MKDKFTAAVGIVVMIGIVGGIIYGSYMLTKTLSYKLWYEDMVRNTVDEVLAERGLLPKPPEQK